MRKRYSLSPPLTVEHLQKACNCIAASGWDVVSTPFFGMGVSSKSGVLDPGRQPSPAYCILACREYNELTEEPPKPPEIKL